MAFMGNELWVVEIAEIKKIAPGGATLVLID